MIEAVEINHVFFVSLGRVIPLRRHFLKSSSILRKAQMEEKKIKLAKPNRPLRPLKKVKSKK